MQIVLARLDDTAEIAKHGRVDVGQPHIWRTVKVPAAVMWVNNGDDVDLEKAKKFAASEGYTVFCYHGEKDPLRRAKSEIIKAAA
jgi:hypothetical protein